MRIRKNGKVVTLTESDLRRIVKRVIREDSNQSVNVQNLIGKSVGPLGLNFREQFENPDTGEVVTETKKWIITNFKLIKDREGNIRGYNVLVKPNASGGLKANEDYPELPILIDKNSIRLGTSRNPYDALVKFNNEYIKNQRKFYRRPAILGKDALGKDWSIQKAGIRLSSTHLEGNEVLKDLQSSLG